VHFAPQLLNKLMPRSLCFFRLFFITTLALGLTACAGYGPTDRMLGSSREQVIQLLGAPSTEKATPDGRVLMFPRGPFGKHTYFVYLNEDGMMTRWTQVLDEKNFALIQPGMTRDEVVSLIGEARDRFGLARDRGYVWNYRYVTPHCFWFQIEFTREDTVRSTGYGKPPECRVQRLVIQ
jgi:hypothetical protein